MTRVHWFWLAMGSWVGLILLLGIAAAMGWL